MAGFTRVETGRFNDDGIAPGPMISGPDSHSKVLTPDSTAWLNMIQIVTGGEVIPYTHPEVDQHGRRQYPYTDPRFPGAPARDIP